ncbi:hypothetical protein P278_30260 [Zhouia amylolytica AD3]|uniref:Uncharacterized protein n=1 Tax=Zhouia amylolytica AD3 TaxID=1286632 RepID=W2ULM0_9FLAO|nr:hypothetical protein P278_30260 [Zhouia amylolytica AD3]
MAFFGVLTEKMLLNKSIQLLIFLTDGLEISFEEKCIFAMNKLKT